MFDTHTHLNDPAYDAILPEVLGRAAAAGVTDMAVVGVDLSSSRRAVQLARDHPGRLHAVVGLQPNCVAAAADGDFGEILTLLDQPGVVAIGETGLDRHWDDTPWADQLDYFDRHLDVALDRKLPVVIHMRDCGEELVEHLAARAARAGRLPTAVMHSFTGTDEVARRCVELGLYVSFAGMVTFKKSDALREVAASIPTDRLLIETDCPYLSPEPLRGRRPNEPARVGHILTCLTQVRGVGREQLDRQTTANARRFFGLG